MKLNNGKEENLKDLSDEYLINEVSGIDDQIYDLIIKKRLIKAELQRPMRNMGELNTLIDEYEDKRKRTDIKIKLL